MVKTPPGGIRPLPKIRKILKFSQGTLLMCRQFFLPSIRDRFPARPVPWQMENGNNGIVVKERIGI